MVSKEFDPVLGFKWLQDLVRQTALPATPVEICDHGLGLAGKALAASAGAVYMPGQEETGSPPKLISVWGDAARVGSLRDDEIALLENGGWVVASGREPTRLAIALPPNGPSPVGLLVLERPQGWPAPTRAFVQSAAEAMGSSLRSSRRLMNSQDKGVLLVQRNIELETLRELAEALPNRDSEEDALQAALDLVLTKLGLGSGWIFWGESSCESLQLAAHRGIADDFVLAARERGIGSCLCKDVFATGRLRYARNTMDCPRLPELVKGDGPMTHACIPLKFERGIMGVMNIANRPGQLFSSEELKFLETVGKQLCLAVDKVRSARAERRRNAEARALASLARAIGGSLDIGRVLAAVGEYARDLLTADRCGIFLGDDPSDLAFAYLTGDPIDGIDVGGRVDFIEFRARGILSALSEKRTIVVSDSNRDPRVNSDLAKRWSMGSAVLVPLVAHERLEGLLVAGRTAPSDWAPDDVTMADALARHAAVAIENARMFREAQDALMRIQQAQASMMRSERLAAVGTLAASLAHEVRNPLNSIHLQLVLLSRRLARLEERPRSELLTMVETAQQEISRLDGLVEEFLSLSSIDRLSQAEADLEDIVRDVLFLMGPEARENGVAIREEFGGPVPPIMIDREKIKQVLINLVRNAIEAMPSGGSLLVSIGKDGAGARVDIADTGPGIAAGLDVFDFFMTTKHGGTGLGLPIARRIVEAHGGSLTYTSESGRGTTFTIVLRLDESF